MEPINISDDDVNDIRKRIDEHFNKPQESNSVKDRLKELKDQLEQPIVESEAVNPSEMQLILNNSSQNEEDVKVEIKHTMQVFIKSYYENGFNITLACHDAGVSRTTYYGWLKNNPEFVTALNDFEDNLNAAALECIYNAIRGGDAKIALATMKALHPKFKDKLDITSNGITFGSNINIIMPPKTNNETTNDND